MQLLAGVLDSLALTLLVLLGVIAAWCPRRVDGREAKRLNADLLRSLAGDDSLPRGVRRRLALAMAYLALPLNLVPGVSPGQGYVNDVIVA